MAQTVSRSSKKSYVQVAAQPPLPKMQPKGVFSRLSYPSSYFRDNFGMDFPSQTLVFNRLSHDQNNSGPHDQGVHHPCCSQNLNFRSNGLKEGKRYPRPNFRNHQSIFLFLLFSPWPFLHAKYSLPGLLSLWSCDPFL